MKTLSHTLLIVFVLSCWCCTSSSQNPVSFIAPWDVLEEADEFEIKEVKFYKNSTLYEHYHFDESGNRVGRIGYNDSEEVNSKEQYKFDKENRLIEVLKYEKSELRHKEIYNFYPDTKTSEISYFSKYGTRSTFSEKNYNNKELKQIKVENGDTTFHITRMYNQIDTLVEEIYISEPKIQSFRGCLIQKYNDFGKLVSSDEYSYENFIPQKFIRKRIRKKYDQKGQLTSEIFYNEDGTTTIERIEYYDDGTIKAKYGDNVYMDGLVYALERNEEGQPIEEFKAINSFPPGIAIKKWEYNEKGLLSKSSTDNDENLIITSSSQKETRYKYDEQNRLIEKAIYEPDEYKGLCYKKYIYSYSGNQVTTKCYEARNIRQYFYGLGKDYRNPADTVLVFQDLVTMDTLNDLLIAKKMGFSEKKYQYNKRQQITNELIFSLEGRKTREVSYSYDSSGNLTQKQTEFYLSDEQLEAARETEYKNKKLELITYTYYPDGEMATYKEQIDYYFNDEADKVYIECFPIGKISHQFMNGVGAMTETSKKDEKQIIIKTKLNDKGLPIEITEKRKYRNDKEIKLYRILELAFDEKGLMTKNKRTMFGVGSKRVDEYQYEYTYYE